MIIIVIIMIYYCYDNYCDYISFGRRKADRHQASLGLLRRASMNNKDWCRRVELEYVEFLKHNGIGIENAVRRLLLLKQAIRTVTNRMTSEYQEDVARIDDDKLGWKMAFIRAAEEVRLQKMQKRAKAYPHLQSFANCLNPNLRTSPAMAVLWAHAVELARNAVTDAITELQREDCYQDEPQRQQTK